MDKTSNVFVTFENWLLQNGAKFQKLELKDYGDEMRACHAVAEIEEEETIVEVPLKCLITVEMGKETQIGRAILDSNIELDAPKHIFLMIFMLLDRIQGVFLNHITIFYHHLWVICQYFGHARNWLI